jgi:glycosyltransferase involved in cell wall biosynthesis
MPEFDREGGSRRIFDMIQFLREAGWAVTFVSRLEPDAERYPHLLRQQGVAVFPYAQVREVIAASRPEVALLPFWAMAEELLPIVRQESPVTRVLVESVDLHFVRDARKAFLAARPDRSTAALGLAYGAEMVREINAYAAADGVLTVSQKEADFINDLTGDPRLAHYVPDSDDLSLSPFSFSERKGILFVGNFWHPPNVDALEFLFAEVLPRLEPDLLARHPLFVVGNGLTERIRALGEGRGDVRMVGWVPAVIPYLQRARVSVVPLRYGAGTKRKMIQALMVGTPSVSTSIGTEGLGIRHGEEVLVADDAEGFAAGVDRLLRDEELWQKLARQGRECILQAHGKETGRRRFFGALAAVLAKPARPAPNAAFPFSPVAEEEARHERLLRHARQVAGTRPEGPTTPGGNGQRPRVLVLGVYLADVRNNIRHIVANLARTQRYQVTQCWVALGGKPPSAAVAEVTTQVLWGNRLKSELLNELLAGQDLTQYQYVLSVDDDITLPEHFLDRFLSLQECLGFAIAQPARTSDSHIDLPIVEQQRGVIARQTHFVEIGPLVSFHRSIFPLVFPFDLTSPMGWGYENVWSQLMSDHGLRMGIIDVLPVEHKMRKSVAHYSWHEADRGRRALFAKHPHRSYADCFRVLDTIPFENGTRWGEVLGSPQLSVIIPTYNRAKLLARGLESLTVQTLPRERFEVLVVDDGGTDDTETTCREFAGRLPLRYFRLQHAGTSAAKNLGIFAAAAPLLLLFDDDDYGSEDLLREHVASHERHPDETVAVLGYTTWAPALAVSEVMDYVMNVGHFLFSYTPLKDGQYLDWTYFWAGRISCKKAFLTERGIFRQQFQAAALEDIELGYRLSKYGLSIVFNRQAVQYMNRPITFAEFCRRCENQGRAQLEFSKLHDDPVVQDYCATAGIEEKWAKGEAVSAQRVRKVQELETLLQGSAQTGRRSEMLRELHELYGWAFRFCKVKGMRESGTAGRVAGQPGAAAPA